MKVCLIAPCNSAHTIRWANALCDHGVYVVILVPSDDNACGILQNGIEVISLDIPELEFYARPRLDRVVCQWLKFHKLIRSLKADIIHIHFIPNTFSNLFFWYGVRNLVISVWGSDIISILRSLTSCFASLFRVPSPQRTNSD